MKRALELNPDLIVIGYAMNEHRWPGMRRPLLIRHDCGIPS
jgi:hypothetical protein